MRGCYLIPIHDRVLLCLSPDCGDPTDDANVGLWPRAGSRALVVWRTHGGGSVPRVYTERSDRPWVALNLSVIVMGRYNLGEGGLASTLTYLMFYLVSELQQQAVYLVYQLNTRGLHS